MILRVLVPLWRALGLLVGLVAVAGATTMNDPAMTPERRLLRLKIRLRSYMEDAAMFGLTVWDEEKVATIKKEIARLEAAGVKEQRP